MAKAFRDFYPEYLAAHNNPINIRLHFLGATLFYVCIISGILMQNIWFLPIGVLFGYLLPHVGHTRFQKNNSMRGAYPIFCVLGATKLYIDTWKSILKKS